MLRVLTLVATLSLSVAMLLATSSPASAHERRTVGPYQFVVGFLNEPAFAGSVNGIELTITDPRSTPPKSVEGVEKTLTADVYQGGLTTPLHLALATRFDLPGKYAGHFIPTRPGSYRFVLKGKVEQQDVKVTLDSC